MNLVSLPQSTTLSSCKWHDRLGHTCDKVVLSFLKQHVPTFNTKSWQAFYCKVCAKSKSTHRLAKIGVEIPKDQPLNLLISDIMGPFEKDMQGFCYLLTIRDHVSTCCIVYPLKLRSDAPAAIQETIKQLQVYTGTTPKALRTNNAKEFTLAAFTDSLAKLGVAFYPSLPYSPQENSEAKCLNRTLGDMARDMVRVRCLLAYASASFMHNQIPNLRFPKSSPHQELFGRTPLITTLYPHGADAIVHIPAVHQQGKLAPRAIKCKLLKPLMTGGWLLWDPRTNKMIQLASVIFPQFQPYGQPTTPGKGSLSHVVSAITLDKVPMEQYFEDENQAINSLPLVKDVKIPFHLGEALKGPHRNSWKRACEEELTQMATREVWDVVKKIPGMKTIGHQWVFDLKSNANGSIKKFKARLVARGDKQCPGVDCARTYALTALLMSLRLVLATAVLKVTEVDQSLYIFCSRTAVIAIWIHVDNGIVASNSANAISDFKTALVSHFDIKWSDQLNRIMGLECVFGKGEVAITQQQLTDGILEAYPHQIVMPDSPLPVLPMGESLPSIPSQDATPFRLVIGSLAYLKYRNRGICLCLGKTSLNLWGGDLECSQTGFVLKLGDAPVLWGSKRQSLVALSTCAAEYVALSDSTQYLVQAINQLTQLAGDFDTTIFCNNQAAVQVSLENKSQKRMRYLDRAFFFVKDTIRKYSIKVTWVKTGNMLADALTKRLLGPSLLRTLPFLGPNG
ncbi:hypothetical protein O181_061552 [Austropuccinia psidii MF-1]|uniref:Integrase catalytic domain-containing protein n=1 Tax=Austropuccinia psidii MF-1 TaxID=1389203 RepID=A0A9Q3EQN1_9BASI|nr:hypothetical protein [Austropuccinia psidii MF-1]